MRGWWHTAGAAPRLPGREPEMNNLLIRMGTVPVPARIALQNTVYRDLKAANLLAKMDAVWFAAAHEQATGFLNWASTLYTLSSSGGVTFTVDRGFAGNNVDGYLPASGMFLRDVTVSSQDSQHVSFWILGGTDAAATKVAIGLTGTSAAFAGRPRDAAGQLSGPINSATVSLFGAQATILGNTLISRTGPTTLAAYKDGVLLGVDNDASALRNSSQVAWLRGGSVFCDYQIGIGSIGAGFDATDAANWHAIELAYLQGVGAVA